MLARTIRTRDNHASCHGLRSLHIGGRADEVAACCPRDRSWWRLRILSSAADSGGTFAIKNAEVSSAMLSEKVRGVLKYPG